MVAASRRPGRRRTARRSRVPRARAGVPPEPRRARPGARRDGEGHGEGRAAGAGGRRPRRPSRPRARPPATDEPAPPRPPTTGAPDGRNPRRVDGRDRARERRRTRVRASPSGSRSRSPPRSAARRRRSPPRATLAPRALLGRGLTTDRGYGRDVALCYVAAYALLVVGGIALALGLIEAARTPRSSSRRSSPCSRRRCSWASDPSGA